MVLQRWVILTAPEQKKGKECKCPYRQLQDLVPFLLSPAEALIHIPLQVLDVHVQLLQFGGQEPIELTQNRRIAVGKNMREVRSQEERSEDKGETALWRLDAVGRQEPIELTQNRRIVVG